ncbi:hypothetical protein Tco_0431615 [Tanacetum coccineum]
MSTSKTYQQSLADACSKTRPPMLETGSYIPWTSRFRRYINRKRENQKWLNKALDEGPYQFQMFVPIGLILPTMQTVEDLQGDELLQYDAENELMNLVLLSIPNEIYNSQFEKLVNASWAKKLEKSHDPLALVAHTGSSSRNTSSYYVTHPTSVVDYDDEYQQDDVQTNSEDHLASAMFGKGHYAKNCPKPRVRDSKYFMEQMLLAKQDEAGVLLTDEQNDFLFADASRMEEIEELSANICLMARI